MIIWAGTSSKDVGMVVEHYPSITIPQKKIEVQQVPGRNGDIVISTGAFENYTQTYDAFLDVKYIGGLEGAMPKIVDWLLGHDGYQRLEDTYFPGVYRMAYYTGGAEFVSMFNEYGEGKLTFNCAPEKYLKSGEWPIDIPSTGKILFNPTAFTAYPNIEVDFGSGAGMLTVNRKSVTLVEDPNVVHAATDPVEEGSGPNIPVTTMVIDTKRHRYYADVGGYGEQYPQGFTGRFEDLRLGKKSTISWSGGITAVRVIPNWWTI